MNSNHPISYDFHGDIPISHPFDSIKQNDIHIYLDVDTNVGVKTCGQACNHCWFVNYPNVRKLAFEPKEGSAIYRFLIERGFQVFARYTDSFAYDGALMRHYGLAQARTYFHGVDAIPADTMKAGEAWTSGKPLLGENHTNLLDLARDSGYGTITITFHGYVTKNLSLDHTTAYPIKGVMPASEFEKVIGNIKAYNQNSLLERSGKFSGFRIGVGVTVGRHNCSLEALSRYVQYFNALGVSSLRFNRFFDHGRKHPHLALSDEMAAQVYRDIRWIHDNIETSVQLGVSEDFGTYGIEVLGFPPHVGWCQAGKQLFAIIPRGDVVEIFRGETFLQESIGSLVGCVNVFEPVLGTLVRNTDLRTKTITYELDFDHEAIDDLVRKRTDGTFKNGCFARELMDALDPQPSAEHVAKPDNRACGASSLCSGGEIA